jgi:hypothetical protein
MIALPEKFGKEFNPGKFKGADRVQDFLAYIGIDEESLELRGCVLPAAFIPFIGDCIDFDASDQCSPSDVDGDGFYGFLETRAGSNPNDASSTPEMIRLDEQQGTLVCKDNIDNDQDGRTDRSDDGCRVPCEDFGLTDDCSDSDRDGWLNYVEGYYESEQDDPFSTPESAAIAGTCDDGADNDLDGQIDATDFGCG